MKFRIYRTSNLFSENCPCEGAFKEGDKWYINIESENLEGLMKLIEKEGSIIISSPQSPVIEIYDDYRE